jgi:hypothetical protein
VPQPTAPPRTIVLLYPTYRGLLSRRNYFHSPILKSAIIYSIYLTFCEIGYWIIRIISLFCIKHTSLKSEVCVCVCVRTTANIPVNSIIRFVSVF